MNSISCDYPKAEGGLPESLLEKFSGHDQDGRCEGSLNRVFFSLIQ